MSSHSKMLKQMVLASRQVFDLYDQNIHIVQGMGKAPMHCVRLKKQLVGDTCSPSLWDLFHKLSLLVSFESNLLFV
jgi:hypothetical protein